MHDIKKRILDKFGGGIAVASICGVTPGAVSQWGFIPARHQSTLLRAARDMGISLTAQEFYEIPDIAAAEKKDDGVAHA